MEKYLSRIKDLYSKMDRAYEEVASKYNFSCRGCGENCCTQRFHHHTLAEYLYLSEGLKRAEYELIGRILTRARIVVGSCMKEAEIGGVLPLMCPVNEGGLCALYEWRPMICRMHGLPHSFRKPDGERVYAGGCNMLSAQSKNPSEKLRVDRTPFYGELAEIEKELRLKLGYRGRYKKTTAEMLMDIASEMEGGEG